MKRRSLLMSGLVTIALVITSTAAWAYLTAPASGHGSGTVARLASPSSVAANATGHAVAVTWTGVGAPALGSLGYFVTRTPTPSGTPSAACDSSPTALLPAGPLSCTDDVSSAGTYTYAVTASYATWTATSGPSAPVIVGRAQTTTSLSLATTSVAYGNEDAVTVTSSVLPQFTGTPTGTIAITTSSTPVCTITLPATTCTTAAVALAAAASSYPIIASYSGDATFLGSASTSSSLTVTTDSTTAVVSVAPSTVTYGYEHAVTVSVTVATSHHEVIPVTGEQISITVGSTSCTATLTPGGHGASGSCTIANTALAVSASPYAVTATYGGDANLAASSLATASPGLTVVTTPTVTTASLAGATRTETGYSQSLRAVGGSTPFTWAIIGGSLPAGLTLDTSAGSITGTVDLAATTQTFTVQATDAFGATATATLTITVAAAPSITTSSLANATQTESAYSQTLAASGGSGSLTWSISTGSLPSGLSLASATGIISGAVGSSATSTTVTVAVSDGNGATATRSFSLTVVTLPVQQAGTIGSAVSSVSVTLPNAVAGGNTLILTLAGTCTGGAHVSGVAGGGVTTWSPAEVSTSCTSAGGDAEIWYGTSPSGSGASPVIAITLTGATDVRMATVSEYGGVSGLDPSVNSRSTKTGTTSTSGVPICPSACIVTPSHAGELVIATAYAAGGNTTQPAATNGPTNLMEQAGSDTYYRGYGSYRLYSRSTSLLTTWAMPNSGIWAESIAFFTMGA